MTTVGEIIRAAVPDANEEMCDWILWSRTPYPCGNVTAQSLYRAANRVRRCREHNRKLCEMCDRAITWNAHICSRCEAALARKE